VKKRTSFVAALLALLLVMGLPLYTQAAADEKELIEYVGGAFKKLAALKSYSVKMDQTTQQAITVTQGSNTSKANQDLTQTITGKILQGEDKVIATEMTLDQNLVMKQPSSVTVDMRMEMILVDGKLYARFSNLSANVATMFPKGWLDLIKDASKVPGFNTMNKEALLKLASVQVLYPINGKTVQTIAELDSETLDGVDTRLFEVDLDPEAVYNSGASSLAGLFNEAALGVNAKEMVKAMFKGMKIHLKVWISTDDQFVRQVEGTVKLAADLPGGIKLDQTTTVTTAIADFDEPVEIVAPKLGATK
jgi:hypothetical protein